MLAGNKHAAGIKPKDYAREINLAITEVNKRNIAEKGFTDTMTIPKYSKRTHVVDKFFWNLFSYNPELVRRFLKAWPVSRDSYSEMPKILQRILEVVEENQG